MIKRWKCLFGEKKEKWGLVTVTLLPVASGNGFCRLIRGINLVNRTCETMSDLPSLVPKDNKVGIRITNYPRTQETTSIYIVNEEVSPNKGDNSPLL